MQKAVVQNLSNRLRLRSCRSVHDLLQAIGSETEHWKRPRRESHGQSHERTQESEIDEYHERFYSSRVRNKELAANWRSDSGTFFESANALTNCLQTRDTARKTDQSMLEAAKSMSRRKRTMTWTANHNHKKTMVLKKLGTGAAVLVPRHRARVLVLQRRQRLK